MQLPKFMNTYKFRRKRATVLAHQMQNFLRQADGVTPKIMHTYIFRLTKGLKFSIFRSQIANFS